MSSAVNTCTQLISPCCCCCCCCFGKEQGVDDEDDDISNILIFGVTGMVGGAVMDAALGTPWFRVYGFTRALERDLHDLLNDKGVEVVKGDMNIYQTCVAAMVDIDVIFLTTSFWESMNMETEVRQGFNVVSAALRCGVKHLIYMGTDYSPLTCIEKCNYLEGKARIEGYIVSSGIPYTIIHPSFFFENFLSVFKPYEMIAGKEYAIALPMGKQPLNCGSLQDFGHCITKIALRPARYVYKTMRLSSAYLTMNQIVMNFNKTFNGLQFVNPLLSIEEYRSLRFEGAEELTTMFVHLKTQREWDFNVVYDLYPHHRSLPLWLSDNAKAILDLISEDDNMKKPDDGGSRRNLFKNILLCNEEEGKRASRGFQTIIGSLPFFNFFSTNPPKDKDANKSNLSENEKERNRKRLEFISGETEESIDIGVNPTFDQVLQNTPVLSTNRRSNMLI